MVHQEQHITATGAASALPMRLYWANNEDEYLSVDLHPASTRPLVPGTHPPSRALLLYLYHSRTIVLSAIVTRRLIAEGRPVLIVVASIVAAGQA